MQTGVYEIVCLLTGERYVGSTGWGMPRRWAKHRRDLLAAKHHSVRLQEAWTRHGADAFEWRVLEETTPDQAVIREQVWFDRLKPEFNTNSKATSCLGTKRTPEQRERYAAGARKRHAEGRGATHGLLRTVQTAEHARGQSAMAAAARKVHAAARREGLK